MTPLVLLPGMMCDARLFAPQIAALSATRTIHVAPIGDKDNVADLAAQVLAHAPPMLALAGLSMGGIVAMEIYRQSPNRIERIAFLDTNPLAEMPEVAAGREPQIAKALAGGLRSVMRDEMKPRYLADGPNKAVTLDLCMEMAMSHGVDVFVNQSRALQMRSDQQEILRKITVPTLALCGRDDTLCPVHRHELICDLVPGTVLEIIEGAGHLPTLEQPEKTTAALAHWLENLDG